MIYLRKEAFLIMIMDDFKNYHIYNLLNELFNFDEDQYGNYIKDIINLLIESEKNGETFIDIDSRIINNEFKGKGWPDRHIDALKNSRLIQSLDSPFILQNRKLSFVKWSNKVDKNLNKLLIKINNNKKYKKVLKNFKSDNEVDEIINLFEESDLVLLQGGPGTGKSTLIIKLILHYLQKDCSLNIGLSAPTGKASARLKESLDKQKKLSSLQNDLENIECQTLHRWIYNSVNKSGKLKYNLKELDLFIIDEMSMVNISIIETILNLLAKDCKLLLVGDANQLPPINNCSIWNYIFTHLEKNIFNKVIVNLKKVYRNTGDIEMLSNSIFSSDNSLLQNQLTRIENSKSRKNVKIIETQNKLIPKNLLNKMTLHLRNIKDLVLLLSDKKYIFKEAIDDLYELEKELVNNIFKELNSQLVLCQKNSGEWGVNEINRIFLNQIEPYDFSKLDIGIPIMCIENNNELGISNGDIGVILGKGSSRKFLFRKFNKSNKQVASLIDPNKLENIVPALAITIHKSQGSESDNVNILWRQNFSNKKGINNNQSGVFFKGD